MFFPVVGLVLTIYIIIMLAIFVVDFNYLFVFFKYEAPNEIAVFKRELRINSKAFDYIAIGLFLFILPYTYYNLRKEC